jgi:hypothetical protein
METVLAQLPFVVVRASPTVRPVPLGEIVGAAVLQGTSCALFDEIVQSDVPSAVFAATFTVRLVPASELDAG